MSTTATERRPGRSQRDRAALVEQLSCDITVRRRLHEPCPQLVRYRATFRLGRQALRASLDGFDGSADRSSEICVGSADIVVLPTWDQATFVALDDGSWELAAFGRLLRSGYHAILTDLRGQDPRGQDPRGQDPRGQDPRGQDLDARPDAPAGVVLVDQVSVDPPWRGACLGLAGTGLALQEVRRDAAFAVLYPMQPGLGADAERAASRRRLTRYWSRLGFTHRRQDHLVLDLLTGDLDAGLDRVARRHVSG